ncbi:MAG TPA: pyrroline-5-carboxylate reductase [Acidimicrobiales bacterium]|jgi:pyrroline-5-carboxylate reductase|nr:pyrroline-5-carboxylate reductase [Acidimicrobiales bacterium]
MTRLLIVGGGRMGEALLGGLIQAGWAPAEQLAVSETDPHRREALADRFPGLATSAEPVAADGVVIAVKPQHVAGVADQLSGLGATTPKRVLSIAAGITLTVLESHLPAGTAVVRAVPNTPSLVGAGAAGISAGTTASVDDLAWATGILEAVGTVIEVPEPQLDAVTGLSGSGPAYVFLVAEALIEAGVLVGLSRTTAIDLTIQLLLGSARLLSEVGDAPAELRAAVTSPGGTTAAGLRELERAGVRAAFLDAVAAATARSRELG